LAKEPAQGSQLRARLDRALGALGEAINDGQIYVTLGRLERAGLVTRGSTATDRKVYQVTPDGHARITVSWPRPDLAEFHLKLIAAGQAALADPVDIVSAQRRELLRRLRDAQRLAMAEPDGSEAGLLLEGIVLRLQADLRWLDVCERSWTDRRKQ
jgi:DNA-binding PadR family transcriptional regulator